MPVRDQLFAQPRSQRSDFNFDEPVAAVFDDMIRRSLPGYDCVLSMLGVIASRFAQAGTCVYDLGCSLGSATLALHNAVGARPVQVVGVDKSPAMAERARRRIAQETGNAQIEVLCQDVCETVFRPSSLIVLNFTLQFLPKAERRGVLERALAALVPGGALVLSEKLRFDDYREGALMEDLHDEYRRSNGYSQLEISQKRTALENVLVTESEQEHVVRLEEVGFSRIHTWFRCANFVSILATKDA